MKKKILIIDDELSTCLLLERTLGSQGFSTSVAHNGQEGLDALKKELPDLIILDVLMPVMDGFTFLQLVKDNPSYGHIPIIMLTIEKARPRVEKGITLKADFYLSKPFESANLLKFIHAALGTDSSHETISHSIKKSFPDIGEIEYKIATTREEIEGAMALVLKEYAKRRYIDPKDYKSNLRVSMYHLLPTTITYVGLKNNKVVITVTSIPDTPLGLPMDTGYHKEVEVLRTQKRKIFEIGYLAIDNDLFPKKTFSLFNFQKFEFIFTLITLQLQQGLFHKEIDDACIVVNPKVMIFKFMPFKPMGEVKYYGFDYSNVNKKAAIAKRWDLKKLLENINDPHALDLNMGLNKMFLGKRLPPEVFQDKPPYTPEDLHYFFVKKSDVLKSLTSKEKEYIMNVYNLDEDSYFKILTGKF